MTNLLTVLEDGDRFTTMKHGEILYWQVWEGIVRQVPIVKVDQTADWTLDFKEKK